jgi:hypothetical protein
MTPAEQKLFNEMIMHSIKAVTEDKESHRDYHKEMYEVTKRVLWKFQEDNREK